MCATLLCILRIGRGTVLQTMQWLWLWYAGEFAELLSSVWPRRFARLEREVVLATPSASTSARRARVQAVEALLVRSFGSDFRSLALATSDVAAHGMSFRGAFTGLLRHMSPRRASLPAASFPMSPRDGVSQSGLRHQVQRQPTHHPTPPPKKNGFTSKKGRSKQ